jgi:hypothetical protein
MLSVDIACRLSTGADFPDGSPGVVGQTLMLNSEDDASDTIRPRVDVAGGDANMIHIVDGVGEPGDEEFVDLTKHLDAFERELSRNPDIRLITVDPILAHVGLGDSHKDAEMRRALNPLAAMAARHRVCVLCVTHTSKTNGPNALNRVMGSRAFGGVARAVWHVRRDPDDPTRNMMLAAKSNLGPIDSGLAFRIELAEDVARVAWESEAVDMTADDAIAKELRTGGGGAPVQSEAEVFLEDLLSDGAVPAKQVRQEARDAEVAWRTVERAKRDIGARSFRERDEGGVQYWVWDYPSRRVGDDDTPEESTDTGE